jgi:radical SAM protein with 4Fe4S-binding SPASM domain
MASSVPMNLVWRVLQSPDLVRRGVRNAVRKRVTAPVDYRLRAGVSAPPVQVDMKINNACNLRCRMCPQWGEAGYNHERFDPDVLPLEVYQRLIDEIAHLTPWLYIWGGEPFLYRDLVPLLAHAKGRGLTVSLVTNGTRVEGHGPTLVDMGLDILLFSVDGPRDTHDNIRGYQGAFEKTVGAIRTIQAEKRRRGRVRPYVVMVSVITADNQDELEAVFELASSLEIDLVLAVFGWFQTPESGRRHTEILERELGVTPWSWRGFTWSVDRVDPDAVQRSVARVKARDWPFHYMFHPRIPDEAIGAFYRDHGNTFGYSRCTAPWVMAEITPNGDVVTCRDYPDVVVGNITTDRLLDVWNGERLVRFRRLLQDQGGKLPICNRCHGLMGC